MLQLPTDLVYANNNPQYLQNVTNDSNHPLGLTTKSVSGFNNYSNKTFQGSFTLNYKIPFVKGLTAKFMFGFYDNEYFSKSWAQKWMMYSYDKLRDVYANTATKNNPSTLGEGYTTYKRTTTLGQLNYEKSFFEKHNVKASLVYEKRYDTSDDMYASKQFAIDIPQFNSGLVTNMSVSGSNDNENSNLNYIARLNYDFSTKYLLEFGFNYSGSSKFPVEKRWGFFPYTSAGWRISEENFFKSALPFVTNLKLRASIGKMGDDAASSFQFLTGYNYPGGNYVFNNTVVPGLGFRGMPNPNITWFTVTSKNAGFDLNLKNGLFTAQFDLFRRDRSGLLSTRLATIPGTVGAALPQENLNSDMRKGYELVLGHSKTIGDFRYEISANVTYTRGQATYLERASDANSYLNWRNNKTNRWDNISWGYNYIGQFQSVEEILSSPLQDSKGNASVRPGDLKFEDVNKDGVISDLDMVPIGRGVTPEMSFGVSGRLSYRQFDMNFLFQGAANSNYFYDLLFANVNNQVGQARNTMQSWMDRWHHEDIYDPTSPWVPGKYPAIGSSADSWAGTASQFWYVDSKYLRLKNVEIGYTLKKPVLSKIGVENLRIYLSGFNLLTWTKVDYVDPEQDSGYWNATYPISKIYNIGVTFTF
jgi:TonB-linked SusC/RagA family outer membrane protein